MMQQHQAAAAVLVAFVAVNGAYAWALPAILDAAGVPVMPHGFREAGSPVVDAGTVFVDVTEVSGVRYSRFQWRDGDLPYPAVVTGGLAAGDMDRDGWVDLYFPPGGPHHPARLYRNLGNWSFADVTDAAGLNATGFGAGAAFADVDNDGDSDLYVTIDGGGHLHLNDGNGTFTEATEAGVSLHGACGERPCQPSSVTWLDADGDGLLDLYVVMNLDWQAPHLHTSGEDYASLIYFAPRQFSILYRNTGNATFEDATATAGVANTGKGLGVVAADMDGDGDTDLATANDITPNALYLNDGAGTFREIAKSVGASEVKTSMGIAAGDVDGDGDHDLVVSNFRKDKLSLLMQGDDGAFTYETVERGLGASWRGTGWGVALLDHDLDGWLDIAHAVGRAVPLEPHEHDLQNVLFPELKDDTEDQLFRNLGNGRFGDATGSAGDLAGATNTRAILAVDLDNDGDEDLVRVNVQGDPAEILRNDLANGHGSIQLTLQGTASNRDAIGARVEVALPDGRLLVRERAAAAGYQTGLSPVLTIGLGDHAVADVTITWPSGLVETFDDLQGGRHHLTEGAP